MLHKKHNSLEWLEFELLQDKPNLHHALFLRVGGYSVGNFASLNVGAHVGDCKESVQKNRMRIEDHLSKTITNWQRAIWSLPCHGTAIRLIDKQATSEEQEVDGVATTQPKQTLVMTYADCQIAFFYDPVQHVIANIHVGWKGTTLQFYEIAVNYLANTFGSKPKDLLVCISPSLGPAESEFIHYKTEFPAAFWPFQIKPNYFDLWAITEYQLLKAGILPHHIEIARCSTYDNAAQFYSYRRDKTTGRHAACLTLL